MTVLMSAEARIKDAGTSSDASSLPPPTLHNDHDYSIKSDMTEKKKKPKMVTQP